MLLGMLTLLVNKIKDLFCTLRTINKSHDYFLFLFLLLMELFNYPNRWNSCKGNNYKRECLTKEKKLLQLSQKKYNKLDVQEGLHI